MSAPVTEQSSKALDYIKSKNWKYRDNGSEIILENCPFKHCDNYHFYVNRVTALWDCKKCGENGNLDKLMGSQGDRPVRDVLSMSGGQKEKEELPSIYACHEALIADEEAIDYLVSVRRYKYDVIVRQRLGLCMRPFKKTGWKPVKTLVIPHIVQNTPVWMKYRTLPPAPKDFDSPKGWDASLYNEDVIVKDMPELILVEGEGDCLALMSQGVEYVCGVPGANIKKADWIEKLDTMQPGKIYILYDADRVGQRAAQELAERIGIEKCWKITLPPFRIIDQDGTERDGKDINEWFAAGHTVEEFEELKKQAKVFSVSGVMEAADALDELEEDFENGNAEAKYKTKWQNLNSKIGGFDPGDVVDILAEGKFGKTTWAMNILEDLVARYNESAFLYCLEMPQKKMARKWASHVTQTDDTPGQSKMTVESIRLAKQYARDREAELLFGYSTVQSPDDVYDKIRQVVRRYGVKFVCFDNLQLLCDKTLKNENARTIHMSQISKKLKDLAMELKIVLFRIIQPHQVKEGEIASARRVDGSSQISKDCDLFMVVHRNRLVKLDKAQTEAMGYIDEVNSFDPKFIVIIDLARYAPGGTTTLWFDGGTSTVREFQKQEMVAATAENRKIGLSVREAEPLEAPISA